MKKKILVVEDNRVMLNFLIKTIEKQGHQVVSAEDGLSALDILTAFKPDIIFLDLIMPKIDGEKLCRIIRKMQHLSDCYVVIISAAAAELKINFTEMGADRCIAKAPFGKMAEHVSAVLKECDVPRNKMPTQIIGIDDVYSRQLTKELISKSDHLETILESISEGILEIYSERVVYANSGAALLFGLPEEKLLAAFFIELFEENIRPRVEYLLKSEAGGPSEVGMKSPLEINDRLVTIKKLPVKGHPSTNIILITDVTKRNQLEMHLQHVQRMDAVGTIASGVAHNFRNTLAGILVNNQVIQMNLKENSALHEESKRIDTSVKKGVQLIETLLQFSHKQNKVVFQKFNLATEIKETYRLINELFDNRIKISVDVPETLPVVGDPLGLTQALMNLCTNARDSMPSGGELKIEAMAEEDRIVIIVSDTGHGMDKDTAEKCFNPFFTTKKLGKGTGLGLSTTYGIIKNHGGEISVASELNRGSVFKIFLPLGVLPEQNDREHKSEIVPGNNEKVLVVDDEIEILKAMMPLLGSIGYRSAVACSGKEAVEKYKAWQPDIVLMDINMPEMDGITCIERIAAYDPNAKTIIISGYQEHETVGITESNKKYIKGFLTKPVGIYEFSTSLALVLK